MPIFGSALYCKFGAIYKAHPPVDSMWTVVPGIYNELTSPHIQASICNLTYLRCYWRYIDNSMCAILQTWCQIQRASSTLRNVNCGTGHIQWKYSSIYSGSNIQLIVSAQLLEICRQFREPYTVNMVPNTAHDLQFAQCGLWSRTYTMYLQLHIFRVQYSNKRSSAAIGDISTMQCAVTLQSLCQVQDTTPSLRNAICGPGHIQCNYSSAYSGFIIQRNVAPLLLEICRQFTDILQIWSQYSV
jgi:hypothetical protein